MKNLIVAIDGPAGSGKSSVAMGVAKQLGYLCLDTGAMYRAIAFLAIQRSVLGTDAQSLIALARDNEIDFAENGSVLLVNKIDITEQLYSQQVGLFASRIAVIPEFHDEMLLRQRDIGRSCNLIAVGRDTTTAVFPYADLKIFMTATLEERAKRRLVQLNNKGVDISLAEIIDDVRTRDKIDFTREHNPLRIAEGAVVLDTTNLTINQSIEWLTSHIKQLP